MVRLLARVIGVGIETADMLAREVLSRNMRGLKKAHDLPAKASAAARSKYLVSTFR